MYGGLHSPVAPLSESALAELALSFTPRIQAFGATPVLMDLHGLGRAFPTKEALGHAILDAARERALEANLSLSHSRVVALVLARAQAGLSIVALGKEAAALAPLPLRLLELDRDRAELFARWGLRTFGDLQALPSSGLFERLGAEGPRLMRLALGEDVLPLVPTALPEAFELRLEIEWPVDGLEPLAFLLTRVLEPLCAKLSERGRKAVTMTIQYGLVDGNVNERLLKPLAPTAEARTWRTLALLDLEAHPPREAIQSLALRAVPTVARRVQFSLLDPAQASPEKLAETLARLHEWTRDGRSGAAHVLDTHRPGAFAVGSFAPGPIAGAVREAVTPRLALRAFRPPLPASVRAKDGAPEFLSASGVSGPVLDRAGPWRVSSDWWDAAFSCDEWDVLLASGGLYRIYRDRLRDAWFVAGELD
jgi:protein ImuB